VDLMWQIELREGEGKAKQWELVKEHLSVVIYAINSATSSLKKVTEFN